MRPAWATTSMLLDYAPKTLQSEPMTSQESGNVSRVIQVVAAGTAPMTPWLSQPAEPPLLDDVETLSVVCTWKQNQTECIYMMSHCDTKQTKGEVGVLRFNYQSNC